MDLVAPYQQSHHKAPVESRADENTWSTGVGMKNMAEALRVLVDPRYSQAMIFLSLFFIVVTSDNHHVSTN